jgi:hypothetical protein
MHPSEYEEYNALSYGYPLVASGRTTSGVADDPGRAGYAIRVSRSNPALAGVAFEYTLGRAGDVTVDIYNDLGDRVAVLVDGRVAEGSHVAEWDASGVPSGAYFCRIAAGAWRDAVRFVVQH